MSTLAHPSKRHPATAPTRHQAVLLFVFALVMASTAPLNYLRALEDAVSIKQWRQERRLLREERKRRERETPLYTDDSVQSSS